MSVSERRANQRAWLSTSVAPVQTSRPERIATRSPSIAKQAGLHSAMFIGKQKLWHIARDITAQLRMKPNARTFVGVGASYSRETHTLGDIVANLHLERPNRSGP